MYGACKPVDIIDELGSIQPRKSRLLKAAGWSTKAPLVEKEIIIFLAIVITNFLFYLALEYLNKQIFTYAFQIFNSPYIE
ncbi:hypothetical protein [Paenisporosarcina sp. OV554]|uniref:hypothetical protein n=1 Tax=Paenisporosarcina sp. OV554 TaxID=2135694 RepID=UPI000D3532F4|nr:hypothetical protein [Paenisporosarcina sp. OV554]